MNIEQNDRFVDLAVETVSKYAQHFGRLSESDQMAATRQAVNEIKFQIVACLDAPLSDEDLDSVAWFVFGAAVERCRAGLH